MYTLPVGHLGLPSFLRALQQIDRPAVDRPLNELPLSSAFSLDTIPVSFSCPPPLRPFCPPIFYSLLTIRHLLILFVLHLYHPACLYLLDYRVSV